MLTLLANNIVTRKVTKSVIRSCNSRDRYNPMAKVEKKENPMPERFLKKRRQNATKTLHSKLKIDLIPN